VASLAWGGVRGTGGDWSVIDHAAQPLPTPPRTCPSSMLNYTVWTANFCPVSGTFCINR